jgi:prohibitin 2
MPEFNPFTLLKYGSIGILSTSLAIAFWPIKSVPTGHRGIITVGGAIKGIESEGFTFVLPWQKLNAFNIRAEQVDVHNAIGSTSDQQPVEVNLTVRYNVQPDKISEVFEKYSKDGQLTSYVTTSTLEVFKAITAKYTAVDLINNRAEVSNQIVDALRTKLAVYCANVISIDTTNFSFDKSYMDAIKSKVTQEQLKLAATNEVLTIQAQQQAKVVQAQAEADSLRIAADGKAYAVEQAAMASAKALQIQNDALSKNKDVLELRRIEVEMAKAQQWDGKLPTNMYSNAPMPLFNLNH